MATISQIHALRIDISDPPEFIKVESVTTKSNLPADPEPQTAYYVTALARYFDTEKTSGADPADYKNIELFLSDAKLNTLINMYGYNVAIYKALKLISSKIWSKLLVIKNTDGATSTEYIRLNDLYKYYKSLVEDFKDDTPAKTGKYCNTKNPTIAGGNL